MDLEADVLIALLSLALVAAMAALVILTVITGRARRARREPSVQQGEDALGPVGVPAFGAPSRRTYHRADYADELHCIACETLLIEGTPIYVVPLPDAGDHAMLAVCQGCARTPLGSAG